MELSASNPGAFLYASKPRARARASADRIGSEYYTSTASLSFEVVGLRDGKTIIRGREF
jgi:hypothetical protein